MRDLQDALTEVQGRCTELILEMREMKRLDLARRKYIDALKTAIVELSCYNAELRADRAFVQERCDAIGRDRDARIEQYLDKLFEKVKGGT